MSSLLRLRHGANTFLTSFSSCSQQQSTAVPPSTRAQRSPTRGSSTMAMQSTRGRQLQFPSPRCFLTSSTKACPDLLQKQPSDSPSRSAAPIAGKKTRWKSYSPPSSAERNRLALPKSSIQPPQHREGNQNHVLLSH